METSNFETTIIVEQSPRVVFEAINNVSAWWHGEVIGNSNKLNDEFSYQMKEFHYSVQKVIEIVPNKKVIWLVTESKLNFINDKSEWTGTKICFEISLVGNKTQVRFIHVGLNPEIECYDACSNGWTMLIQRSLYSFITKGKGEEVF